MDEQTLLDSISEEELENFQHNFMLCALVKTKIREYFIVKFKELESKNLSSTDLVVSLQEFQLLRTYMWDEVIPTYQRRQILGGAVGVLWGVNIWVTNNKKTKLGCYPHEELALTNPVINAILPIDTTIPDFFKWTREA